MSDREKVFDAFRNCITEPKCKDCPWEQCEQFNQKKVSIPTTLALDVLNLLKEQEAVEPIKLDYILEVPYQYKCGNCKTHIRKYQKYCDWCGRKVKWE